MNEEILTYNTQCSEEILRKINQSEFKRLWKNNLKKNTKNLYWGITFMMAGVIAMLLKNYIFAAFFIGFSLATISSYFNYLSQYKQYKKV
ncbi:MAG: hypothetical protein AB7E26_09835, partial [Chryseobacterium sp.]